MCYSPSPRAVFFGIGLAKMMKGFILKARLALLIPLFLSSPGQTQSIGNEINRVIQDAAERSVNRTQQATERAEQAYNSVNVETISSIDPQALYGVVNTYKGPWKTPKYGPVAVDMLGSSWLKKQGNLSRDDLLKTIANRLIQDGYIFFRISVVDNDGSQLEVVPLEVKLIDNGLQLKNIIQIKPGSFFKLSQLQIALFQLNNKGESSYKADIANIDDVIYLSFTEQRRSAVTTILNINNYDKRDMYGYTGTASLLGSDLLNLNESLGLSYTGNMATVDQRSFSAYNGFLSVPVLGYDLSFVYGQSFDRNQLDLLQSTLKATRKTENYGVGVKSNFIFPDGNTLGSVGALLYRNNSWFRIYDTDIAAQTYSYRAAEFSGNVSYRRSSLYASGQASLTRSFSYSNGDAFTILRTHAEVGDRLPHQFRYRVSVNTQNRVGGASLPSSELFYAGSPTRVRLPFDFEPLAGERGFNVSSTLSYDTVYSGIHRGWVAIGAISPFVGLDYGRTNVGYASTASVGLNIAMGQNNLQLYIPKVLSTSASGRGSSGVFLTLQAQF